MDESSKNFQLVKEDDNKFVLSLDVSNELKMNIPESYQKVQSIDTTEKIFGLVIEMGYAENISKNMAILRYLDQIKDKFPEVHQAVEKLILDSEAYPSAIKKFKISFNKLVSLIYEVSFRIYSYSEDFLRLSVRNNQDELGKLIGIMSSENDLDTIKKQINELEQMAETIFLSDKIDINLSKLFGIMQYLDTRPSNKKCLEEIVKEKIDRVKEFEDVSKEKSIYDSLCLTLKSQLKELEISKDNLNKLRKYCDSVIKRSREVIDSSDDKKLEIFNEINDPKKEIELLEENQKRRKELQNAFVQTIKDIQTKNKDILKTSVDSKILQKKYHSIFILDKSGSMSSAFALVKQCVLEVVQSRRNKLVSDEKVSIIKFNHKADFDAMEKNVADNINISEDVDGGTSFIEPLKKLDELFDQIEGSIYLPVIFFLSDGQGESLKTIIDYCNKFKSKHKHLDFIFFTVGFGIEADQTTLEEMAKALNKGGLVLKVGNDLIKLYHHADSRDQLSSIFTLYQKLFDYQRNLAQQQMDILNSFSRKIENDHNNEKNILESMLNSNIESIKKDQENMRKRAIELETDLIKMNEECENKINQANMQLENIKIAMEKLLKEEEEICKPLGIYEMKKKMADGLFETAEKNLQQTINNLNTLIKFETAEMSEIISNAETNRNIYLDNSVQNAENMGVKFLNENDKFAFRKALSNLQENYIKLKKSKLESSEKINLMKNELQKATFVLKNTSERLRYHQILLSKENLNQSIWLIVLNYCNEKYEIINSEMTQIEVIKEILFEKVICRNEEVKALYLQALELIVEENTIEDIFKKLESDSEFEKHFLDYAKYRREQLKDELEEIKEEIKENQNESNNETCIKELEKQIAEHNSKRSQYLKLKSKINSVTNMINNLRLEAKENYFKKYSLVDINKMFILFRNDYYPHIQHLNKITAIKEVQALTQ